MRVERDPETGAILRIIRSEQERLNPLNDPLNGISDNEEFIKSRGVRSKGIVGELEEQAAMEAKPRPREQSSREQEWIARLLEMYGDDYGTMVRDRKLNPYQQTEGDIRRRIKKWKEKQAKQSTIES